MISLCNHMFLEFIESAHRVLLKILLKEIQDGSQFRDLSV